MDEHKTPICPMPGCGGSLKRGGIGSGLDYIRCSKCEYRVPAHEDDPLATHDQIWKWKRVYQLCKELYVDQGDHEHGCSCNDCIERENEILRIVRSEEDK